MTRPPTRKLSSLHKSPLIATKRGAVSDAGFGAWAKVAALGLPDMLERQIRAIDARRGLVLLAGDAGAGKARAAAAIAQDLGKPLQRLDLAGLVSPYAGEAEKRLDAVLNQAQQAGAVLLFDEADALFGKRSTVRDAHDRYAEIETNALLARLEAYDGVVILVSTAKQALDEAFLRRLRATIVFPQV